ncbi:quinone-dependent dihydroorotate dehydrogenase [Humisphaera borealis]|uniref:Dihydroorotate dehydrogenase (quinone) n=1 Tax=Humisphaera borealis TaxID=2807512 RepID=A0A7M2WYB4_9BACT|nr:quinone-dependent dihydroorotate dehydrogenase [Humisphaera borealis]QOV90507.1 quinone-dependent dihydroorotate dehydrogenase [Humisphaera borealis]
MSYALARTLLFRLDPEEAHDLGVGAARWLAGRAERCRLVRNFIARPSVRPVELMGLTFPTRVGLAAGLDKNAEAPLAWWAFGFGFAELGTVTPRPQSGKPKPRMFRVPARQALINRMGFNNQGARRVAERLAEQKAAGLRPAMPLLLSVGKNATTPNDRAAEDYNLAATSLAPHADVLTINVSSPNTPGLRALQNPQELTAIVRAVLEPAAGKPVLVKVAPELEGDLLRSVLDACLSAGATGFIATNTLAKQPGEPREDGGLSGQPLRQISRARVAEIRKHVGDNIPLIGCGGINDAESARAMLDAGADLIQLYTALVYQGPFLAAALSRVGFIPPHRSR